MDTSRVGFGEAIAAAGGLSLLVCMFLPWFGGDLAGFGTSVAVPVRTGWESFGMFGDLLVFAAVAVAVGMAAGRAMNRVPPLPVDRHVLVLVVGVAAFLLVLVRLVDPPAVIDLAIQRLEVDVERKPGAFVALAAAAAIAYGGLAQARERTR